MKKNDNFILFLVTHIYNIAISNAAEPKPNAEQELN
jgi:hypothetical protein